MGNTTEWQREVYNPLCYTVQFEYATRPGTFSQTFTMTMTTDRTVVYRSMPLSGPHLLHLQTLHQY